MMPAVLRTVTATRYVTPLREGGSMPGIVEADDDGLYVLKFRGAGQGTKALAAELVAGEVARALGLPVPELVFVELDPALGAAELRVEVDEHELRDVEPEGPPDLPRDELGHQRARPLAGAAELQDVEAVVVGLDEPGHRAALAQRRHVPGRGHQPRRRRRGRAVAHGGDLSEPRREAGIFAP